MNKAENVEKGYSGINLLAMEDFRTKLSANPNYELIMMDYADFNVQHTIKAQQIPFEAAADIAT